VTVSTSGARTKYNLSLPQSLYLKEKGKCYLNVHNLRAYFLCYILSLLVISRSFCVARNILNKWAVTPTPEWPAAEYLTPRSRNTKHSWVGGGSGLRQAYLCPLLSTGRPYRRTERPTLYSTDASAGIRTSLKVHCLSLKRPYTMRLVSRPVAIPGFHETRITVSSGHTLWYRLRVRTININKFLQKLAIGIDLVVIHKRLAAKLFGVSRPPHIRWYMPQSQLQGIMVYGERRDTATCLDTSWYWLWDQFLETTPYTLRHVAWYRCIEAGLEASLIVHGPLY
jgi:hypothetical protein